MTFAMTQQEMIELLTSIQSRAGKKLARRLEKAIILSKSEKLTSKKLLQTLAKQEKKHRPPSAWHLFLQDFRDGDEMEPGMTGAEVAKAAAEPWSKLSDIEKKNYENRALFLRNKFYEELSMKDPLDGGYANQKKLGEKKHRPKTAWMFFLKDFRGKHSTLTNHEQIQQAAKEWKVATPDVKNLYQTMANNEKNNWVNKIPEKIISKTEIIKTQFIIKKYDNGDELNNNYEHSPDA